MTEDRVVAYLRARGQVEPPADLVDRTMSAVAAAGNPRSPFAAFMPAAAVAAVAAIVAVVGLLISQGTRVGPPATPRPEPSTSPVSYGEMQAALTAAISALREAPGVEGMSTTSVYGELGTAQWFSWRPNGDQVVVQRDDVDVSQSAWWLDPEGGPPARGRNVIETIRMIVGDEYFEGTAEGWSIARASDAPPVLTFVTALLEDEESILSMYPGEVYEVSVTELDNGGEEWTLSGPFRDGTAISRWRIGPAGELRSWASEFDGVTPTVEDTHFETATLVEIRMLTDAASIKAPDLDSVPDAEALGLPPDFPLRGPSDP